MPEGAVVCNLEERLGDRGAVARASGNYATIVSHNPDDGKTKVKLPSGRAYQQFLYLTPQGAKKTLMSGCRGMVGVVAGGGRTDKPLLKAGTAYHKYKAKRKSWPRVRGVCMNVSCALIIRN